jgi:geranylgeranyl diphosphate synthase type I
LVELKTNLLFEQKLKQYKKEIDDDIAEFTKRVQRETLQDFGHNSRLSVDAYLEILSRGGKRIRGALVLHAYEMSGGQDKKMIIKVARAIEMIHAYILIIDDIQDRSAVRRDGPTAHKIFEQYHSKHQLAGDSKHFGLSIALNSALWGAHRANSILTELDIDPNLKSEIIAIVNHTMEVTAHGQTGDIVNEVVADVSETDVEQVLRWKTAMYTFLNPLQVGMVLAGSNKNEISLISDYALHAGVIFQITDDILGTFSSEVESGKSPMDDMHEGKRTLLTVYALNNADSTARDFLLQNLGNPDASTVQFERFKEILIESGALDYANKRVSKSAKDAIDSLQGLQNFWPDQGVEFLRQLVSSMLNRRS